MCGSGMMLTFWVNDFILTNQMLYVFLLLVVAVYTVLFVLSLYLDHSYYRYIVAWMRLTNIIFYLYLLTYVFQACF